MIDYNSMSEDEQIEAVKMYGNVIQYIDNPSKRVQLESVRSFGDTIKYIKNQLFDVQLAAIDQNPYSIKFINDKYHIQGYANAAIHIGLIFDNNLVACMSFGNKRIFMNSRHEVDKYELIRYASAINVQGGASKLLTEFERKYKPKEIISYADARWSEGNLYKQLNFNKVDRDLSPGYWYTNDYINRSHRYNFTKKKLVKMGHDESLTEWDIMQSLNYDRIWDCGQYKFIKTY